MHGHSRRGPKSKFELPKTRTVLIVAACVFAWMSAIGYYEHQERNALEVLKDQTEQ